MRMALIIMQIATSRATHSKRVGKMSFLIKGTCIHFCTQTHTSIIADGTQQKTVQINYPHPKWERRSWHRPRLLLLPSSPLFISLLYILANTSFLESILTNLDQHLTPCRWCFNHILPNQCKAAMLVYDLKRKHKKKNDLLLQFICNL